ncbi:hypothetical protein E8E11_005645 [Didymella keratinophila]|nr:hypothetical protein E8E11_005645 [Didymella keratinophila]
MPRNNYSALTPQDLAPEVAPLSSSLRKEVHDIFTHLDIFRSNYPMIDKDMKKRRWSSDVEELGLWIEPLKLNLDSRHEAHDKSKVEGIEQAVTETLGFDYHYYRYEEVESPVEDTTPPKLFSFTMEDLGIRAGAPSKEAFLRRVVENKPMLSFTEVVQVAIIEQCDAVTDTSRERWLEYLSLGLQGLLKDKCDDTIDKDEEIEGLKKRIKELQDVSTTEGIIRAVKKEMRQTNRKANQVAILGLPARREAPFA